MAGSSIGHCTRSLEMIETLSKEDQTNLLQSVALDIQSAFTCIGRHLSKGTIDPSSADPIYDLIRTICNSNTTERKRSRRKISRLRKQRSWMRMEYRRLRDEINRLGDAYKARIERETRKLELRLSCVTKERDILLRTLYREGEKQAIEAKNPESV